LEQAIVIVRTNNMNERIEQLAEQCWVHTNEPLFGAKSPHWEFDRQKFAELIVKECVYVSEGYFGFKDHTPGTAIAKEMKQHFGVEE